MLSVCRTVCAGLLIDHLVANSDSCCACLSCLPTNTASLRRLYSLDKFKIHRHLIAKRDQWIGGAVEPIRMDRPRAPWYRLPTILDGSSRHVAHNAESGHR